MVPLTKIPFRNHAKFALKDFIVLEIKAKRLYRALLAFIVQTERGTTGNHAQKEPTVIRLD